MMEAWNSEVSSANLGIWMVLRRSGEIVDSDDLHSLKKNQL
jgi:hypothetical protein